jgi:hypothetical protein
LSSKRWKATPPKISGYVQVHFKHAYATGRDSSVDNDNFRVQRVRIGLKGDVFPWLSYDVEIDPRTPGIAGLLRDAFLTFRFIPRHELRVGQQKTQFGYENRESSSNLFAVNRTEISEDQGRGVNLRDIGVGLIGNMKLGGGFRFEDAITVVNGAGMNVQMDDTPKKNVWGRAGVRYKNDKANSLLTRLGVSGGAGDFIDPNEPFDPSDDLHVDFKRMGVDFELDHSRFFLSTEYMFGWDEDLRSGETDDRGGYYVNLVGKTGKRFGPIVRYDVWADDFRRWTLGAFYGLPSEPFRVLINYELRQLRDGSRQDDKLYIWTQVRL